MVEVFVISIRSEPGYNTLPVFLLCLSIFVDEQYLSFLVCRYHHFIVALLFVKPVNDPACVMSSTYLGYAVMGYISHLKILSSSMVVFLLYHAKVGEVFYNTLFSVYIWTSDIVSAAQHHLFVY